MKAQKAMKRLAKIEALMSDVTERYSTSAPNIRKALQDAKTAVTRAKNALNSLAASDTAKDAPVKQSKPTPKVKRKATAKKAAVKRATVVKRVRTLTPKAAKRLPVKKAAKEKAVEEIVIVARDMEMAAAASSTEATAPKGYGSQESEDAGVRMVEVPAED
jgi:hypothetical protein